ncbi:MAG: DUF4266 domain-containing protein [Polyangiales bacterium]
MDLKTEKNEASFLAHVNDAREGAGGGAATQGGGCGCN